jgi:hemerythrin-like domain-containing protein
MYETFTPITRSERRGLHIISTQVGVFLPLLPCRATTMARDILKTLKQEHGLVRGLFEDLKETTDRAVKKRAELLEEIEANLILHAKWEEKVFYPAFKERADRDGLQTHAEALSEHHAVETSVIPEVHAADPGTPEFAGRSKVFGEFIDHHAKEEEKTMFKMARELFTAQELAQLDEDYEGWKASPDAEKTLMAEKAKAASGARPRAS